MRLHNILQLNHETNNTRHHKEQERRSKSINVLTTVSLSLSPPPPFLKDPVLQGVNSVQSPVPTFSDMYHRSFTTHNSS